jgi:hypothetical protein
VDSFAVVVDLVSFFDGKVVEVGGVAAKDHGKARGGCTYCQERVSDETQGEPCNVGCSFLELLDYELPADFNANFSSKILLG